MSDSDQDQIIGARFDSDGNIVVTFDCGIFGWRDAVIDRNTASDMVVAMAQEDEAAREAAMEAAIQREPVLEHLNEQTIQERIAELFGEGTL